MYLLCTYANGIYWRSSLEPLLYPSGCSFYRPFSYRADYLSERLSTAFTSIEQRKRFLADEDETRGIFGISFNSREGREYYERFIPLRMVTLTDVQFTDEYHLFFRLGEYITLTDNGKLRTVSLAEVVNFDQPKIRLMFDSPKQSKLYTELQKIAKSASSTETPTGLWERFIKDEALSPTAKENFTGATVLRLLAVRAKGESAKLMPMALKKRLDLNDIRENNYEARKIFGYELRARRLYDFQFAYSRLVPTGQTEGEFLNANYEFGSPGEHFDIARAKIPITGNYRYEEIWIQPKRGRPAVTSLDWFGLPNSIKNEGNPKELTEQQGKLIGVRVPILVHGAFWTAERITYVVGFVVFGLIAYWFFSKAYQFGSVPPQPNQPPSPLIAISTAVGAFFAGTAGAFLQSLAKAFIEDRK